MIKIDYAVLIDAVESREQIGFCLGCGFQEDGVEPDARGYECDACGEPQVYEAEEIVLMGAYNE